MGFYLGDEFSAVQIAVLSLLIDCKSYRLQKIASQPDGGTVKHQQRYLSDDGMSHCTESLGLQTEQPSEIKLVMNCLLFSHHRTGLFSRCQKLVLKSFGVVLTPFLIAAPAAAAERVVLSYGMVEYPIALKDLETDPAGGGTKQFHPMERSLLPLQPLAQSPQLQQVLTTPIPFKNNQVSHFLDTPMGQQLLDSVLPLLKLKVSQDNRDALQSAAVAASKASEGLSLLSLVKHFPNEQVEVDLGRGLELVAAWRALQQETHQMIGQIQSQAQTEATRDAAPPSRWPDFRQHGYYTWEQRSLSLYIPSRDRHLKADLYLPITRSPRPLVIISHGLGAGRANFDYLAQHLVGYGFAVAAIEHPGSNTKRVQALFDGRIARLVPPEEFVDRPLDVTDLLNELERLNRSHSSLNGRLDLQKVGLIGQSFGGYTALLLAGAPLRLDRLNAACADIATSLNPSLLLQCRAQELPQTHYQLADPRIKAAIAINPVGSALIAPEDLGQIKIPFMMMTSSADLAAPVLAEQIEPFIHLGSRDKYLVLMQGSTHLSVMDGSPGTRVISPIPQTEPSPTTVRNYITALSTVFAQTHIADHSIYRPYLSAAYTQQLSQPAVPLSLVRSLSPEFSPSASHLFNPVMVLSFSLPTASMIYVARMRRRLRGDLSLHQQVRG